MSLASIRSMLLLTAALWLPHNISAQTAAADHDRAALLKVDAEFATTTAAKGLEGFLSYFAEDAVILPARAPVISGKDALRSFYSKVFATPGFSLVWEPLRAEISRGGDLGYTFGTYKRVVLNAQGKADTGTGKYLTIWRKQSDGSWKVVLDMGN